MIVVKNGAAPRRRGRPRGFDKDEATGKAAHLFWSRGYEGVSVDELTAAMGITAQSLYAAFGSKEQLHQEALAWYDREVTRLVRQALTDESSVVEAVRGALRTSAREFTKRGRPAGCMRSITGLSVATGNDAIARQGGELRRETLAFLRSRLDRGVAEGQIDDGADIAALALYLNAIVVGMAVAARDGASTPDLLVLADLAAATLPVVRTVDAG